MDSEEISRRAALVTSEFEGVLPHAEAFYIRSLMYSTSRSLQAFDRYNGLRGEGGDESDQVSAVHEALGHAAALSRFLFPSPNGKKIFVELREARARKIRGALELSDETILKERALRNALEHFDERLDAYLLTHDAGYFFPDAMIGDVTLADDPAGNIFKLIDAEKEIFVLLGEKFYFGEVRKEVEHVHRRLLKLDERSSFDA